MPGSGSGPSSTATRLRNALVEGCQQGVESALDLLLFVLRAGPTLVLAIALFTWPARLVWRRLRPANR